MTDGIKLTLLDEVNSNYRITALALYPLGKGQLCCVLLHCKLMVCLGKNLLFVSECINVRLVGDSPSQVVLPLPSAETDVWLTILNKRPV